MCMCPESRYLSEKDGKYHNAPPVHSCHYVKERNRNIEAAIRRLYTTLRKFTGFNQQEWEIIYHEMEVQGKEDARREYPLYQYNPINMQLMVVKEEVS